MNDVSFHVPFIFGNKLNSKMRGRTEGTTEDREDWYQERPTPGPDRSERGKTNLHGNSKISKCLCIIIRSCKIYKG